MGRGKLKTADIVKIHFLFLIFKGILYICTLLKEQDEKTYLYTVSVFHFYILQ